MPVENAEDWLEEWADENIQTPGYSDTPSSMANDAKQCREEAKAAGIAEADLLEAAEGNLETYLLKHQNAITDAEVKRLSDKDDWFPAVPKANNAPPT